MTGESANARIDQAVAAYTAEFGVPSAPLVMAVADLSAGDGLGYVVLADACGVVAVYRYRVGRIGIERIGIIEWPPDVMAQYLDNETHAALFGGG